jgi:two-component system chemotaxis response regulator CheY
MKDDQTLLKEKAILERKTVLLVDDQRFVRSIVRASLADIERLVVKEAEDGAKALEILVNEQIDIVVLDINMTPMNGLKTLKAIRTRTHGIRAATPVVMLTSLNDMSVVRSCGELDCQGFLLKPVSKGELITKLARAISREWKLRDAGHFLGDRCSDDHPGRGWRRRRARGTRETQDDQAWPRGQERHLGRTEAQGRAGRGSPNRERHRDGNGWNRAYRLGYRPTSGSQENGGDQQCRGRTRDRIHLRQDRFAGHAGDG